MKSVTGIPLLNAEERAAMWKQYIEALVEGEVPYDVIKEETGVDTEDLGDSILVGF